MCLDHFTPSDNPYYPYMFVVLDERTAQDGTVLLYHDREPFEERKVGDLPEELRITPASIPTLLSCLDIHHKTIPEIVENHMPDGEEETWFDDVVCTRCQISCVMAFTVKPSRTTTAKFN